MKLTGSVGRMGRNDKGDVALVQQALATIKVRGKFGSQPLWKGRTDGRNSRDLEAAIGAFQAAKGLRATGKLDAIGPGITRLRQTLPTSFRATQAIQGTTANVSGQPDAGRAAKKTADKIKAAPFPVKERKALSDAILAVAKELNIALALGETWITRDGRFAAAFEIDGDLAATPSEKGQVLRKIARVVIRNGVWLRRMPNSLDFESRRQLRSLKAAAKTLPAEDRELLELTITPQGPVLAALAQGCAELIRSGAIAIPRGKEEYSLILEAAANADPALAKELAAAADGEARLRKELAALEGAAAAMARTLDLDSRMRLWYSRQIERISDELLAQARAGQVPWEQARLQAHEARGTTMNQARGNGTALGLKLSEMLKEANRSIAEIDAKILATKFGGRSLESLTEAENRRLLELAIESAGRSRESVNTAARVAGHIGRGVAVLTFAVAAYSVYMADDQVREFARQSALLGGGVLGGMAGGAAAGAAVGAATGPGVVIFVAGGILLGGILGSLGAEFAFEELID